MLKWTVLKWTVLKWTVLKWTVLKWMVGNGPSSVRDPRQVRYACPTGMGRAIWTVQGTPVCGGTTNGTVAGRAVAGRAVASRAVARADSGLVYLRCAAIWLVCLLAGSRKVAGQDLQVAGQDLRVAHERAVQALVRVESDRSHGAGWVAVFPELSLIITAAHVVAGEPRVRLRYYDGTERDGAVIYRSPRLDFAVIYDRQGPPVIGLRWSSQAVVRGARVVIGGHPGPLSFITSEGVISGAVVEPVTQSLACGAGRNCVIIDAESEPGSSGGPVVAADGSVIGMLWGTLDGTSFSICVHARTLTEELDAIEAALAPHRVRQRHG